MIDLDGEIVYPEREVAAAMARVWTVDPDADIDAWLLWTAGETHVETLCQLLTELRARRQWMRRHAQHPPTCGAARGEACDCGLMEVLR